MSRTFWPSLILSMAGSGVLAAQEPNPIPADQFSSLHKQIKPQPGESRWMEIPWLLDIHEARRKAAAEGKPILVLSGGGATGIGACSSAGRSVGRAPRRWTEETVKLIQDHFIAVSASNYDQNRQDSVGQFVRECGMKFPGAGGSVWCVTADGKLLGNGAKLALEKWKTLPQTERAPGAVKVPDAGPADTKLAAPTPPADGLIFKLYYRAFMREAGGKLRYVTARDLWHDEQGERTEAGLEGKYPGSITTPQAQPDHMWLTEAEWKSLIPDVPRKGESASLPAAIRDRLCCWHLNPLNVYGEANPLARKQVRAAELKLTITDVSDRAVHLRLDGFARLGAELPKENAAVGYRARWGFEPRLLGYLEYDRKNKVFTRFDMVALGDHFGKLGIADSASRPGIQPLGIAFEMVTGTAPADRTPPGRTGPSRTYFDPSK